MYLRVSDISLTMLQEPPNEIRKKSAFLFQIQKIPSYLDPAIKFQKKKVPKNKRTPTKSIPNGVVILGMTRLRRSPTGYSARMVDGIGSNASIIIPPDWNVEYEFKHHLHKYTNIMEYKDYIIYHQQFG